MPPKKPKMEPTIACNPSNASSNEEKAVSRINQMTREENNQIGGDCTGMDVEVVIVARRKRANVTSSCPPVKKKPSGVFSCKKCGEKFPVYHDHLFRKHLRINHDDEIMEDDVTIFEKIKIAPTDVRRCKKCYFLATDKFEEHQTQCQPSLSVDSAFETLDVVSNSNLYTVGCGLCPTNYCARYELKEHIKESHPHLFNKIIVDPAYRCASCLKCLDESVELMEHCAACTETRPRIETLVEFARSCLNCDVCQTKHVTIEETFSCDLKKGNFRCIFCFAVFKSLINLYTHSYRYHSLKKCYVTGKYCHECSICADGIKLPFNIIAHHMVT